MKRLGRSLFVAFVALLVAPLCSVLVGGPAMLLAGSSGGTTSGGGSSSGAATSVQGSATLPATCTEKDLYQDTDSGGTEFYVCTAANTWVKTIAATDNVATATALAANGSNCSAGNYPLGVDASGAVESCTAAPTGTIGGSTGATDNAILRADGVGGVTAQSSPVTIDDTTGVLTAPQSWKHTTVGGATYTADYGGAGRHIWSSANGSGYQFYIAGSYLAIDSAYSLGWTTNITGAGNDAGFARSVAGVVKVTDGVAGIRGLLGGGTAIASATALPVPTGRVLHVTGNTTPITSITSTNFQSGVCVTLIFDDIVTFTDGSNLKLAGDFVTTADDTISLCYDGTSWFETSRSVN